MIKNMCIFDWNVYKAHVYAPSIASHAESVGRTIVKFREIHYGFK